MLIIAVSSLVKRAAFKYLFLILSSQLYPFASRIKQLKLLRNLLNSRFLYFVQFSQLKAFQYYLRFKKASLICIKRDCMFKAPMLQVCIIYKQICFTASSTSQLYTYQTCFISPLIKAALICSFAYKKPSNQEYKDKSFLSNLLRCKRLGLSCIVRVRECS